MLLFKLLPPLLISKQISKESPLEQTDHFFTPLALNTLFYLYYYYSDRCRSIVESTQTSFHKKKILDVTTLNVM